MINNQMNISMLATKMVLSGYEPANCIVPSGKRVAIIVPFRDDGSKGTVNCLNAEIGAFVLIVFKVNALRTFLPT